ncbi:MAG: hypothetical protein AAGJ08_21085 [Cyanobacteria bacterium P01_H01_bin.35]
MSYKTTAQHQFKTLIYEKELDRIAGWVEEYPDLETGGDLFGFWTHSGAPVIQYVLGPGCTSRHNPTSFYQDKEHLIKAGEILRSKHGLQHIGEWHSHHQLGLAQPSGGDENTVFRALEKYNFPRFLLCIANLRPTSERNKKWNVNVGCFLFTNSSRVSYQIGGSYQVGAWVVLPGESPISSSFQRGNSRPSKSWSVEKTSLEAEVLVTTEPIEISEKLWYTTPEGQGRLKELYDLFDENFQECEMRQDNRTERVYFTFLAPTGKNYDEWRVEFPDDFPKSSPLFQRKGEQPFPLDWSGNNDYFRQIKSFIKKSYKKKQ